MPSISVEITVDEPYVDRIQIEVASEVSPSRVRLEIEKLCAKAADKAKAAVSA